MKRGATGRDETATVGGETVRTFVPAPLPPVPPLDLGGTRHALLEQATLALGRLDGVTALLPDTALFLYSYVRKEALLSSQIEGTQSSLLLFELEGTPGCRAAETSKRSHPTSPPWITDCDVCAKPCR